MAVFIALFAVSGISLLVLSRAATAVSSVKSGRWSDPTVWSTGRVPEAGDTITIESDDTVTYDVTTGPVLGATFVKGTLTFDAGKSSKLTANKNMIVTGRLVMQSANPAIEQYIQFVGFDETHFVGGGMNPIDSDVGLWVMENGKLDLAGAAKTSWTHLADDWTSSDGQQFTVNEASGWRVGDEIFVSPTEPPTAGLPSYDGFEERRITAISGNTITVDGAPIRQHPKVNNMWTAEVGNVTRNVRIEGSTAGNSHVFIRSTQAQTIRNVSFRYMGAGGQTRIDKGATPLLGRYGVHFHHNNGSSTGSVVEGSVVRDNGQHAFVPHASDGILMKNNIAYNTKQQAFWWDPHDIDPDSDSNEIVYDHNLVARMDNWQAAGARNSGFLLGAGLNDKVINNTVVGANKVSAVDGGGYFWNNSNVAVWTFDNNVSHNNNDNGLSVWQNSTHVHPIGNFVLYYNQGYGISHGAYANDYHYFNGYVYGNKKGGAEILANSNSLVQQHYDNVIWDGAGIGRVGIYATHGNVPGAAPIIFRDNVIKNHTEHSVELAGLGGAGDNPKRLDFINSTLQGPNPIYYGQNSANPGNLVRVQPADGSQPYQVAPSNGVPSGPIAAFAPTFYGTGGGLLAEYFSDSNLQHKIFARYEPTISDHFGEDNDQPPYWINPWPGAFTIRWTGEFQAQADGNHTFIRDSYWGARVWLGNDLILDAWQEGDAQPVSKVVNLKRGQKYPIRIEGNFLNGKRTQILNLFVEGPGYSYPRENGTVSRRIVLPMSQLYCSDPQCKVDATPYWPARPAASPTPSPTPAPAPAPTPPPPPPSDTSAPSVSITAPSNNATVSGTFNVTANASDNVGVTQVEFLVDGQSRSTDTASPYSFSLNTTQLGLNNGNHTIQARARDAAGNSGSSSTVTINVNNTSPTPPPPPPPTFIPEDVNQDGHVNILDVSALSSKWGQTSNLGRADVNGDGRVNLIDFSLIHSKYGT